MLILGQVVEKVKQKLIKNMSQVRILKKIAAYMDLQLQKTTSPQDDFVYLKNLCLRQGFCQGFVGSWSLMSGLHERGRWMVMLKAIDAWDGQENSLDQMVFLPSSFLVKGVRQKLQDIFELVISNVVIYQGYAFDFNFSSSKLMFLKQRNVFEPKLGILEGLNAEGCVEKILARNKVGGHFSLAQLVMLLAEAKAFKKAQYHFYNCDHVIAIDFMGGECIVYDPNYDISIAPVKLFKNLGQVAKEIFRILGHNLCFEVVALESQPLQFVAYEKWLQDPRALVQLLEKGGLHTICIANPNYLDSIVDLLKGPDGHEITSALLYAMHYTTVGVSGFQIWMLACPESLMRCLEFTKLLPGVEQMLATALTKAYLNKDYPIGFLMLAHVSTEFAQMLVEFMLSRRRADVICQLVHFAPRLSLDSQKVFLATLFQGIENYSLTDLLQLHTTLLNFAQEKSLAGHSNSFAKEFMAEISKKFEVIILAKLTAALHSDAEQDMQQLFDLLWRTNIATVPIIEKSTLNAIEKQVLLDRLGEYYVYQASLPTSDLFRRIDYLLVVPVSSNSHAIACQKIELIVNVIKHILLKLPALVQEVQKTAKLFMKPLLPDVTVVLAIIAELALAKQDPISVLANLFKLIALHANDPVYRQDRAFSRIRRFCVMLECRLHELLDISQQKPDLRISLGGDSY